MAQALALPLPAVLSAVTKRMLLQLRMVQMARKLTSRQAASTCRLPQVAQKPATRQAVQEHGLTLQRDTLLLLTMVRE